MARRVLLASALALVVGACDAAPNGLPAAPIVCAPDACAVDERCDLDTGACHALCPVPLGPDLARVDPGATLRFGLPPAWDDATIEVAATAGPPPAAGAPWQAGDTVALDVLAASPGVVTVRARVAAPPDGCEAASFEHTYEARPDGFAPAAGAPGSDAVAADDPRILAWADAVAAIDYGADVDEPFRVPARALGPVTGDPLDALPLGNGGAATVTFPVAIADEPGPDFAVFENGIQDTFLELAWVEVSTDGLSWARFDAATTQTTPVPAYGSLDPARVEGLAGKYRVGFGVPFDLGQLRERLVVRSGRLDLGHIRYVRVVDIVGDGRDADASGRPIYDPFPTVGSGGFDLDGIAVLNAAQ